MEYEVYGWAHYVKRFWATVMNLLTFVIVDFSDSLLKMLLASFVLIAPFPNAVSVFNLSIEQLHFQWYTAIMFSAGIEFGPFVMIAISLMLFDGYLKGGKRWLWPFLLTTISTIVLVTIITAIVYWLEMMGNGYKVMSLLPWVSVAAFIGLAALAWHKSQPEIIAAERKEMDVKRERKLKQRKEDLSLELLESEHKKRLALQEAQHAAKMAKLGVPQNTAKPTKPFGVFDRKVEPQKTANPQTLQSDFAVGPQPVLEVGGREPENPILQFLRSEGKKKTSEVATYLGVSKPTAAKRLDDLVFQGLVQVETVGQANYFAVVYSTLQSDLQSEEAG